MCRDLGEDLEVGLGTDATAAKSIASRRGMGKVRRMETSQLWLQAKVDKRGHRASQGKGEG